MYAVMRDRGHQYGVRVGDRLLVDRTDAAVGDELAFDLLLVADGEAVEIGNPVVTGKRATAKVLEHVRGNKVRVGTYRKRKDSRRRLGTRHEHSMIEILAIG